MSGVVIGRLIARQVSAFPVLALGVAVKMAGVAAFEHPVDVGSIEP
jgi:hypothetical protein